MTITRSLFLRYRCYYQHFMIPSIADSSLGLPPSHSSSFSDFKPEVSLFKIAYLLDFRAQKARDKINASFAFRGGKRSRGEIRTKKCSKRYVLIVRVARENLPVCSVEPCISFQQDLKGWTANWVYLGVLEPRHQKLQVSQASLCPKMCIDAARI